MAGGSCSEWWHPLLWKVATEQFPVWSPDGRLAFESSRTGLADIYQKSSNGAGVEEVVVTSDQVKAPSSWSKDGRFLLYRSIDPQTGGDLWNPEARKYFSCLVLVSSTL
jgi:Tol biopolymer transport system component